MSTHQTKSLEEFRAKNSRDGLTLRYARGRIRSFWQRQILTFFGCLALTIGIGPELGLIALILVVVGEGIDFWLLKVMYKRIANADRMRREDYRALNLVSGFQAMTNATAICLCLWFAPTSEAVFFGLTFLMAAVINAGLALTHAYQPTIIRLIVYGSVSVGFVVAEMAKVYRTAWNQEAVFLTLTSVILMLTSIMFIKTVNSRREESLRFERDLLAEKAALQTSRRALADEVRKAERLALVARHANDSVIFTLPNGRIEWVNPAFEAKTGYSLEEVTGCLPSDVLNAKTTSIEALEELRRAREEVRPCVVELENLTKDGRSIWMEVSMNPVLAEDGTPDVFIAIERDITTAVAREEELRRAKIAAEEAAQAKSAFLATMSHEIRTPMNGVIGVAELLEETKLERVQRQYVQTIIESGRALLTIINDILDLAKLQSGKADIRTEVFSLPDLLRGTCELLQPTANKKGILLTLDFGSFAATRHSGDPGRLRQIILNLIGNALKFTTEGEVAVRLSLQSEDKIDLCRISVSDTGIGIAPERLGQIFESFTQADNSITRRFGGTGLGLTISRILAQQMGGDIHVASVFGEGSTFYVELRLERLSEKAAEPKQRAKPALKIRSQLKVLIAEDNRTNMMIARRLLEKSVAMLCEAENGKQALEIWQEVRPDLVLMDLSMPVLDGLTAATEIRRQEAGQNMPPCHIVALTAFSGAETEAKCLAAGINAVMTKPLSRGDLDTLIERLEADRFDARPQNGLMIAQRESAHGRYRNTGT